MKYWGNKICLFIKLLIINIREHLSNFLSSSYFEYDNNKRDTCFELYH